MLRPDKISHVLVKSLRSFWADIMEFEAEMEFEEEVRIVGGWECQVLSLGGKGDWVGEQVPPNNMSQNSGPSSPSQGQ